MHIRFDEGEGAQSMDADEPTALPPRGAQPAGPSHPCKEPRRLQCNQTVRTDFDSSDTCFVFAMASTPSGGPVAASLSNHRVKLYATDPSGSLTYTGELQGHTATITEISFPLASSPEALFSSSLDGSVRGWDTRSHQQVEGYNAAGKEFNACSLGGGGNLLAAGCEGRILFWDRRTRKQCACFDDTHAEAVTQVAFHPVQQSKLLSGSVDGLLAVFDVAGALDEDEGFQAGLNIDNSIARIGFYGQQHGEKLWIQSHTETLHLWEWAVACNDEAKGGAGVLAETRDSRAELSAAAGPAHQMDYLISCEYDAAAGRLWQLAGSNEGAWAAFPVDDGAPAAGRPLFDAPVAFAMSGHSAVVRSVLWPGAQGTRCISGGEDSRLCVWSGEPSSAPPSPAHKSAQAAAIRREHHAPKRRPSPY